MPIITYFKLHQTTGLLQSWYECIIANCVVGLSCICHPIGALISIIMRAFRYQWNYETNPWCSARLAPCKHIKHCIQMAITASPLQFDSHGYIFFWFCSTHIKRLEVNWKSWYCREASTIAYFEYHKNTIKFIQKQRTNCFVVNEKQNAII